MFSVNPLTKGVFSCSLVLPIWSKQKSTKAKTKMKIRDVQKIHVESGIPMPAKKSLRVTRRKWHKELSKMNPNDSFVVAKAARPSVYQAARNLGIEVESREIDTYHVRVFVVGKK